VKTKLEFKRQTDSR